MAHLGFTRTVYKSGGGGKAQARIEYITGRTITPLDQATRQVRYIAQGREDLVKEGTGNLPSWAPNGLAYFQAAETYEGGGEKRQYNAFEEWKVLLPHEMSRSQNAALVDDLLAVIVGEALPYTYAFHAPGSLSGSHEQPHIHLLLSARRTDAHARTAATHFKRWNMAHPERGGAEKDTRFRLMGSVKAHRLIISDVINMHLERHGIDARVHPESLKTRGIAREPEPKLLPSESNAYRTTGRAGATMKTVLGLRQARVPQRTKEAQNAREYWEARKTFLGVTPTMTPDRALAQLLLKRHGSLEGVPVPYRRHLTRATQKPSLTTQLSQLARQMGRVEEQAGHGDLHVRLREEKERGLSW